MKKKNSVTQKTITVPVHRWCPEDADSIAASWDRGPCVGYQYQRTSCLPWYFSTFRPEDFKSIERQANQGGALDVGDLVHMTDHYATALEVLLNTTTAVKTLIGQEAVYFFTMILQCTMGNEQILRVMSNFSIKKGFSKEKILLILAGLRANEIMLEQEFSNMTLIIEDAWVTHEHARLQRDLKANSSTSKLQKI